MMIDNNMTQALLEEFQDNLFATEYVDNEDAEVLYKTIMSWKEKADMYDDLCR